MQIEGEVFREPKPEIGRNGDLEGPKVSFFGGMHAIRVDLPAAYSWFPGTFRGAR